MKIATFLHIHCNWRLVLLLLVYLATHYMWHFWICCKIYMFDIFLPALIHYHVIHTCYPFFLTFPLTSLLSHNLNYCTLIPLNTSLSCHHDVTGSLFWEVSSEISCVNTVSNWLYWPGNLPASTHFSALHSLLHNYTLCILFFSSCGTNWTIHSWALSVS